MRYKEMIMLAAEQGLKEEPVEQLNDKTQKYPIFVQYSYDRNRSSFANAFFREQGTETEDAIYVDINIAYFYKIKRIDKYYRLCYTVAHELQHVFDMYILSDKNAILSNNKSGLVVDLLENVFDIPVKSKLYRQIYLILTIVSRDEINARLAELKKTLELLSKNKKFCDELFKSRLFNSNEFEPVDDYSVPMTKQKLFAAISDNEFVQTITRVNLFADMLKELTVSNEYKSVMLISGYYLYKHSCLKFPQVVEQKNNIKMIFSNKDFIKTHIDEHSDILEYVFECVFKSIMTLYKEYVRYVEDRLQFHLNDFFKFRTVSELFGSSDTDEIILLPE